MTDSPEHVDQVAVDPTPNDALDNANLLFADFAANNKYSSIEFVKGRKAPVVMRPWGDTSVRLSIPNNTANAQKLAEALNNSILPERLSAIYHIDRRALEVIWTALNLSERYNEVLGREFEFVFRNVSYMCKFGPSSERLMTIAENSVPQTASETNFRNLQSYFTFSRMPEGVRQELSKTGPTSFWIENFDFDTEKSIEIISNLNFYLRYFDDASPIVIIHDPLEKAAANKHRYIRGAFPKKIVARELDDNLLSFWNFTGRDPSQNPMINFILYYRIIEYAAFHYVDAKVRVALKRILMSPDFDPSKSTVIDEIVGSFSTTKLEDVTRFRAVIAHCVMPEMLWPDVEINKEAFSKEIRFDGGFVARPLINAKDTAETFDSARVANFAETIRKIRNTLSHGKDQETSGVITPTLRNFNLLRPWLHLIATAAGEVVLNKDLT